MMDMVSFHNICRSNAMLYHLGLYSDIGQLFLNKMEKNNLRSKKEKRKNVIVN